MSKKALLGAVLPFISSPVVLVPVGIGAAGWAVYEMFSDKDEDKDQNNGSEAVEDGSEPYYEPYDEEESIVESTVIEPYETVEGTVTETVHSSVEDPYVMGVVDDSNDEPEQDETVNDEDHKKEMIRLAMSELGKRSAAARANKKQIQSNIIS